MEPSKHSTVLELLQQNISNNKTYRHVFVIMCLFVVVITFGSDVALDFVCLDFIVESFM